MKCDHCKSEYESVCYTCFVKMDDVKYYKIYGKSHSDIRPAQKYGSFWEDGHWVMKPIDCGSDSY
jgi:hypothetical protein